MRVPAVPFRIAAEGTYNAVLGSKTEEACIKCQTGRDSVPGSEECTICAIGYSRPLANSSAAECQPCDAEATSCVRNTTRETLAMNPGYWRHSTATAETHRCKLSGSWTPCRGGMDGGLEGDGYCKQGFRGPRCEVCSGPAYARRFDKLDAQCHDCGSVAAKTTAISVAVLCLLLAAFGAQSALDGFEGSTVSNLLLKGVRYAQAIWRTAGMRFKVKALVGFYQCLAAVPSVFDVVAPIGLEEYAQWMRLIELPSELENIVVPAACLGNYRTRIWASSTWPIGLVLVCAMGSMGWEMLHTCFRKKEPFLAAMLGGVCRVLPLTLGLTFLVVPSTSMRLFRTFHCVTIEYGQGDARRYLEPDLELSCDSDDFEKTRSLALLFIAVWPIGIPLLYAVLLWASLDAVVRDEPTALSTATAFLSGDYKASTFWWEPLEMCRKLALTGWLLLIQDNAEHARILAALVVSFVFLAMRLTLKPLKRCACSHPLAAGTIGCSVLCCALLLNVPFAGRQTRDSRRSAI